MNARGQFASGNRWRYVGTFGESASYDAVDPQTATVLDKLLDGVCLNVR